VVRLLDVRQRGEELGLLLDLSLLIQQLLLAGAVGGAHPGHTGNRTEDRPERSAEGTPAQAGGGGDLQPGHAEARGTDGGLPQCRGELTGGSLILRLLRFRLQAPRLTSNVRWIYLLGHVKTSLCCVDLSWGFLIPVDSQLSQEAGRCCPQLEEPAPESS
jgi:hypothetical protein